MHGGKYFQCPCYHIVFSFMSPLTCLVFTMDIIGIIYPWHGSPPDCSRPISCLKNDGKYSHGIHYHGFSIICHPKNVWSFILGWDGTRECLFTMDIGMLESRFLLILSRYGTNLWTFGGLLVAEWRSSDVNWCWSLSNVVGVSISVQKIIKHDVTEMILPLVPVW